MTRPPWSAFEWLVIAMFFATLQFLAENAFQAFAFTVGFAATLMLAVLAYWEQGR